MRARAHVAYMEKCVTLRHLRHLGGCQSAVRRVRAH